MNECAHRTSARQLGVVVHPTFALLLPAACSNSEILNILKYVRPGNGFVPAFPLTQSVSDRG